MDRNRRLGLLFFAPLLLSVTATSQSKGRTATIPPARTGPATISLDVVVTGKNGVPVSGLKQQDFKLLDNKSPVPVASFRAIAGDHASIEVLLVVDAVNVPYTGLAYMREQIEKFLRANGGQLAFPTALAILTDAGTQIQQGFSRDGNADAEALEHAAIGLRQDNRSAGFWGATERFQDSTAALNNLIAREAARPGRKFIVWVSPGWPLLSGPAIMLDNKQEASIFAQIVALSNALLQANVTLYNVDPIGAGEGVGRTFYYLDFMKGVSKPRQVDIADLSLQVLAAQSGGLVLTSSNDIVGELQKCVADGSAYYELSFDAAPAEHRDEYRSLEVKTAQPGLTARTRQGYYAQP